LGHFVPDHLTDDEAGYGGIRRRSLRTRGRPAAIARVREDENLDERLQRRG